MIILSISIYLYLLGPYYPTEAYRKVNYEGTLNVLKACEKLQIKRIVMSSSPSTRFPYPDPNVDNLTGLRPVKNCSQQMCR